MTDRQAHKAFRQDGFALGRGVVFGTVKRLKFIHEAIVGPVGMDTIEARKVTAERIEALFDVLLKYKDLFLALRGGPLFFEVISSDWAVLQDLDPADLEEIVNVYVKGRKAFNMKAETTLTNRVDAWTAIEDEMEALGPAVSRDVVVRPSGLDSLRLGGASSTAWPPSHLNKTEVAWISDTHVSWQLKDELVSRGIPCLPKSLAEIPHNTHHPADIKLFLCVASLSCYQPGKSDWAVHMAPVGFFDKEDREEWYDASGTVSKKHATIDEFLDYAKAMLNEKTSGCGLALGMVTYWTSQPDWFLKWYKNDKAAKHQVARDAHWAKNCVRYGLGIALRKIKGNKYQVIIYDMDHANLKMHPEQPDTGDEDMDNVLVAMREWREEIIDHINSKLRVGTLWQGGKRPELLEKDYRVKLNDRDSVNMTAAWMWDAVNGHFPEATEVEAWGYEKQELEKKE